MQVDLLIVAQLTKEGALRTITMARDNNREMWIAYPHEYEDDRDGPFHFEDARDAKRYSAEISNHKLRKLGKDCFQAAEDGSFTFKHEWLNIGLKETYSYVYLFLVFPEYSVLQDIRATDPINHRDIDPKIVPDAKKNNVILGVNMKAGQHRQVDIRLECKFVIDQELFFRKSKEIQSAFPRSWQDIAMTYFESTKDEIEKNELFLECQKENFSSSPKISHQPKAKENKEEDKKKSGSSPAATAFKFKVSFPDLKIVAEQLPDKDAIVAILTKIQEEMQAIEGFFPLRDQSLYYPEIRTRLEAIDRWLGQVPEKEGFYQAIRTKIQAAVNPLQKNVQDFLLQEQGVSDDKLVAKTQALYAQQVLILHDEAISKALSETLSAIPELPEARVGQRCFISYAWPTPDNQAKEDWLQPFLRVLHKHLRQAGLKPWLDIIDNPAGGNIVTFTNKIKTSEFALLICTESLLDKHNHEQFKVIRAELTLLQQKYDADKQVTPKPRVLPFLVGGSLVSASLPQHNLYSTVRDWRNQSYLKNLEDLISSICYPQGVCEAYQKIWQDFYAKYPDLTKPMLDKLERAPTPVPAVPVPSPPFRSGASSQAQIMNSILDHPPTATGSSIITTSSSSSSFSLPAIEHSIPPPLPLSRPPAPPGHRGSAALIENKASVTSAAAVVPPIQSLSSSSISSVRIKAPTEGAVLKKLASEAEEQETENQFQRILQPTQGQHIVPNLPAVKEDPAYDDLASAPPKLVEEKTPGLTAFQTGYQLYHQGQYPQALTPLRQAAKAGYAPAFVDLGVMYELGLGVDKDNGEALIWYNKARKLEGWFEQQADNEEAVSQFYLARFYQFVMAGKKDALEVSAWYSRAAKQGHAEAQCSLGDCYANGIGVSKDFIQAKQWYEKAAAQGNATAKAQLKALQTPATSVHPSSFFAANSPNKPEGKMEAKQAANNTSQLTSKPVPEKSSVAVVVDEKALGQLLKFVAEGEQDQAEALIKKDPQLLLAAGKVTDLSGRTFENITAFQYALWAMDYHMWTMVQKHLPPEAQAQQCNVLESKGTAHGKHFDLQPLLEALKTYLDNFYQWSDDQHKEQWREKVGVAQKLLPAHVVNEYCRPDRSFDPCPQEWESPLPRTQTVEHVFDGSTYVKDGSWFAAPQLGVSFAFYRGQWSPSPQGGRCGSCALLNGGISGDLQSLQTLWNARIQQLKLLVHQLSAPSLVAETAIEKVEPTHPISSLG